MKLILVADRGTKITRMCARQSAGAREYNNENVGDMCKTQDHNNKNILRITPRSGGKNRKPMTYREALVGLDNSEPNSDF